MRAVVQRVTGAHVESEGTESGRIGDGLAVLLGVECGDTEKDAAYMASKILKLRVFDDAEGKMNLSVLDVGGQVLCVSQFTLLGDARGQNRPAYIRAFCAVQPGRDRVVARHRIRSSIATSLR